MLQLLTYRVLCRPGQDRALRTEQCGGPSGPAPAGLCHSQCTSVCRWAIQLSCLCLCCIFWLSLWCSAYGTQPRPGVRSILCISCIVKPLQFLVFDQFRSFFGWGDHSLHLVLTGEKNTVWEQGFYLIPRLTSALTTPCCVHPSFSQLINIYRVKDWQLSHVAG